jgi:hypothetical protein
MTIYEIQKTARRAKKPMSRPTVYFHINRLGIKPIGLRQKPQRYPDNAAEKILTSLGLKIPAQRNSQ